MMQLPMLRRLHRLSLVPRGPHLESAGRASGQGEECQERTWRGVSRGFRYHAGIMGIANAVFTNHGESTLGLEPMQR